MENAAKTEQKLGFGKIREQLAARCSTAYARSRVEEEKVSFHPQTIEKRLSLTDEMRTVCMFENSFPSAGFIDGIPFLKPLETPSAVLNAENLKKLQIFLEHLKGLLAFFSSKPGRYPCLQQMAAPILFFPEIARRLDSIADRNGEIRDNASEELYKIRTAIKEKEGSISRRMQSILRKAQAEGIADPEASVSIREGRILIPVAAANKRKLPGFVYDESSTGKTVFIEPLEVVELNNQIKELYFSQQREIYRILREFTDFLRPSVPELLAAAAFVGEIDFIRAKALVAIQMEAGKPVLSQDRELKLIRARHPLLEAALKKEKKEIVPLSLTLNREKRILIISGPNAGGKSVCLKTVGLLQYMFQWGLLIPAAEISEFTIFRDIFIDIGDEQSLENDLSTYSSHLMNMKHLLQRADDASLILIDEFGSGTEPAAGGAIAETILEEIERRESYGVITTHYTNLKTYASNSRGVFNGAMLFDTARIQPLYKLETGLPGNSFAFELARKIGLPDDIVRQAEEKAGTGFVEMEKQLRKISRNRRQLDEKLARIKNTDKRLEDITQRYQQELNDIQTAKKQILQQAREEAREILSQTNRRIEGTIREIREAQAEKERTRAARQQLQEFRQELEEPQHSETDRKIQRKMEQLLERRKRKEEKRARREKAAEAASGPDGTAAPAAGNGSLRSGSLSREDASVPPRRELQKGDKVKLAGSGLTGEVLQTGGNWVNVSVGNIIRKISRDKAVLISDREFAESAPKSGRPSGQVSYGISQRKLDFKPNIDLRGQRLGEALESVTRFIDDALMVGMDQVKILHGKGNGILKEEIRKYLRTIPGVLSCQDEDIRYGGSGITVVELES